MIEIIARLRSIAEEAEQLARSAGRPGDRVLESELMDVAIHWHWLAGEATALCARSKRLLQDETQCAACPQKCAFGRSVDENQAHALIEAA